MADRTKPKRRRATPRVIRSYTPWHELMASPTEPLPLEWRTHRLTRMWQGLVALETAPAGGTQAAAPAVQPGDKEKDNEH